MQPRRSRAAADREFRSRRRTIRWEMDVCKGSTEEECTDAEMVQAKEGDECGTGSKASTRYRMYEEGIKYTPEGQWKRGTGSQKQLRHASAGWRQAGKLG